MSVTNIRISNSEILAETPTELGAIVSTVLSVADSALAGALSGFSLPTLGAFKLKVNEVKGVGAIAGSDAYNHLGIFATLLPANAMCAVGAAKVEASLTRLDLPQLAQLRAGEWPRAVLNVRTLGATGSAEYAYKVDDGLWSDFVLARGDELVVSHPRLTFQGRHVIDVRARLEEDPHAVSSPQSVALSVDWEPPEVQLSADRAHDRLEVKATDRVSGQALRFAYEVGAGARSDFGPERPIVLSEVEAQGGVTVLVKDEFGNLGQATWRPGVAAAPPVESGGLRPVPVSAVQSPGCSSVGGLGLLSLALVLSVRRWRRSSAGLP
jgi:hypothetical protein